MRVVTFNVRQTNTIEHQHADLTVRMKSADVVFVQECVHLNLTAFAKTQPGWSVFQVRNGDNDGHANTAVLYRTALGPAEATDLVYLGDAKDTRSRYLAAVKLGAVWYWAAHIFPKRDQPDIAEQLHRLTAWLKKHPGKHVGGLDKNECRIVVLERATGLKWHGIGIDGFLTNLPISDPTAFAKGFSDHQGVSAVVTTPKPPKQRRKHRIPQATDLLIAALSNAKAHGKQEKASRIQRALNALTAVVAKPRHWFPAITRARTQSHQGPKFKPEFCLQRVRICYRIPAVAGSAIAAWNIAKTKHRTTNPADIPRGFPVFWSGGSDGDGHIAISAGGGKCWSTDILRPGFFDYVDIDLIHATWGLTLLGYTRDLNGRPIK